MKVIFDENLPPVLARALQELFKGQHEITDIRTKYGTGVKDVTWIEDLSRDGRWVVISADRRIKSNNAEYEAFRRSKLIGFFMSKGLIKSKIVKQAERLLALWESIEKSATSVEGGAMFKLPMNGSVVRQFDKRS